MQGSIFFLIAFLIVINEYLQKIYQNLFPGQSFNHSWVKYNVKVISINISGANAGI